MLILASGSPRRAKILREHGVAFTVVKTDAEETGIDDDPVATVTGNALRKLAVAPGEEALAADTIVWLKGRIYGKPRDLDEAKAFLRELSGKTHSVWTGVAYRKDGKTQTAAAESRVAFKVLSERDIDEYVRLVNPLDRAGAYDIDDFGPLVVERYEGEYENIMGLPLAPLRDFGIIHREI